MMYIIQEPCAELILSRVRVRTLLTKPTINLYRRPMRKCIAYATNLGFVGLHTKSILAYSGDIS